jgi:hypothetical protein
MNEDTPDAEDIEHPDDPDGFHEWSKGTCEFCNERNLLIYWAHCSDDECKGCLAICLPCSRKNFQ